MKSSVDHSFADSHDDSLLLTLLILASTFTQDRCYSNKAWQSCRGYHLTRAAVVSAPQVMLLNGACGLVMDARQRPRHLTVLWSGVRVIGELSALSSQRNNHGPPSRHLSPNLKGAGLSRSSTLPTLGYSQDALVPAPRAPVVSWDSISWILLGITTPNDSSPTPPLSHSPSSTDSSSGDRTIQMSSEYRDRYSERRRTWSRPHNQQVKTQNQVETQGPRRRRRGARARALLLGAMELFFPVD